VNSPSHAVATVAARRPLRLVAGFAAFEGAWFACVMGAAHARPWAGIGIAAGVIALFLATSERRGADVVLVIVAMMVGLVWDGAMGRLGLIAYAEPGLLPAPGWILALWTLFAVTLREPLRYLHTRWPLAALLGAAGGPLSYAAAARMGACTILTPAAYAVLAVGWGVLTPLLLALARRLDR